MNFAKTLARFSIRPDGASWRWETFDENGRLRRTGVASSRQAAAAWVILSRTQASQPRSKAA